MFYISPLKPLRRNIRFSTIDIICINELFKNILPDIDALSMCFCHIKSTIARNFAAVAHFVSD